MSKWLLAVAILFLGGTLVATDAEARRFGGARNSGVQRNVTAPPAKPAQQQAQGQQQGAQQAAPASAGSRWGGILGGLAIGGLLGYLFGGSGLLGILLIAALVLLAVMAVRALAARRQQESRPIQYAGMRETVSVPVGEQLPASAAPARNVPAGFDAGGFLRAAKLNFLKLQAANDAGRVEEIREFTTDELFEELKREFGAGGQRTEVIGLEAELLELATEGERHWASVRFSGQVREEPNAPAVPFAEVWNLAKPADGSSGWLLAGIQQMH
jgi:predicted lipid-binding transport protein (Tim44 family)